MKFNKILWYLLNYWKSQSRGDCVSNSGRWRSQTKLIECGTFLNLNGFKDWSVPVAPCCWTHPIVHADWFSLVCQKDPIIFDYSWLCQMHSRPKQSAIHPAFVWDNTKEFDTFALISPIHCQTLVKLKDQVCQWQRAGVVYRIPYNEKLYIGQTGRTLSNSTCIYILRIL